MKCMKKKGKLTSSSNFRTQFQRDPIQWTNEPNVSGRCTCSGLPGLTLCFFSQSSEEIEEEDLQRSSVQLQEHVWKTKARISTEFVAERLTSCLYVHFGDKNITVPSTIIQMHINPKSAQSDTHPGAEVEPPRGGLMGSRELQGGRMLIIKRPQVAKFMFIWAARRKFFPAKRERVGTS